MKVIFHSCIDGYITEVNTGHKNKLFPIKLDALKFAEIVNGGNMDNVEQVREEHENMYKFELIEQLENANGRKSN